jgi:hypothetical protein
VPSDPPTGVDKIRLDPTESMRAFLPAARLELTVDGAKRGSSVLVNGSAAIELSVNTGDACVENGELHRDKRLVKVTLEGAIAGVADSPAAASIDIPIDCGAIKWTSGVDGAGGTWSTNPPGTSGPRSNGTATYSSAPSDSGGGCSAAPAGPHASGGSLAALALGGFALVALVAKRRRREP